MGKPIKDWLILLAVVLIIFLSRLPFINAGYGSDPDAWRVANTAKIIAESVKYSVSRFPGNPLQEISCSIIWQGGPFVLNGITALLSAIGIAFFILSLRRYGSKDYIIAGLALAFIPVVYINSTNLMDYIWAMTFLLGSFYFILCKKPIAAGIFLGMAIGCRITSVMMMIPLVLMLINRQNGKFNIKNILEFSLIASLVGAIFFIPAFLEYGTGFMTFYQVVYPSFHIIINKFGVGTWGRVGILAIFIVAFSFIFRRKVFSMDSSIPSSVTKLHIIAWIMAIFFCLVAFFRLPAESGYLIPIIPFILLLMGKILDRRVFIFICIAFMLSPFISFGKSGIYGGPIFHDHSIRVEGMKFAERVVSSGNVIQKNTVIVTGWWLPQITAYLPTNRKINVDYIYLMDKSQLEYYQGLGYEIFYLPEIREFNIKINDIDLENHGTLLLL